jgi:hypothetical protein
MRLTGCPLRELGQSGLLTVSVIHLYLYYLQQRNPLYGQACRHVNKSTCTECVSRIYGAVHSYILVEKG